MGTGWVDAVFSDADQLLAGGGRGPREGWSCFALGPRLKEGGDWASVFSFTTRGRNPAALPQLSPWPGDLVPMCYSGVSGRGEPHSWGYFMLGAVQDPGWKVMCSELSGNCA